MLRKGNQSFPFRKAVQFFWKVKGKQSFLEKVERNWKGKVWRRNFLVPFLFSFNRLKKPWHYKFPKGKAKKYIYLCEGHIKSSQHLKYVRAIPLCLFSFSFLTVLFCQKMENGKDFWNFIHICGKERKWKGMLSIEEKKEKAFLFWQEGKERKCFLKKMDRSNSVRGCNRPSQLIQNGGST